MTEGLLSESYEDGAIRLARPLARGVERVGLNDPSFSDLAGVLTGVKPVTYTDCSSRKAGALAELCRKLGLKCLPAEKFLGRDWHHLRGGKELFFIGRDLGTLRAAALAWNDPANNERWAGMLGYPRCCIAMYSKWLRTLDRGPDLVEMALRNTRRRGSLDFRLNNVCNYSSRIHADNRADQDSFEKFTRFNRGYVYHALHVIGWHPCAYDCRQSLRKAAVIYSFIEHHAPAYAAALKAALAKPVLFWGKFRYAFVDGRLAGGRLRAPAVSRPRSLLDDRSYRSVAFSEEIKVSDGRAEFFRGGRRLLPGGAAPAVLNFEDRRRAAPARSRA